MMSADVSARTSHGARATRAVRLSVARVTPTRGGASDMPLTVWIATLTIGAIVGWYVVTSILKD
jgi:hypothetical protein